MGSSQPTLILIDGNNYIGRAFHATPRMSKNGLHTNAVVGFINILLADLRKLQPTHVGIVFDKGGKPNWRRDHYPEYKANRRDHLDKTDKKSLEKQKMMQEMYEQGPYIRKLVKAMGFRVIRKTGVEADDLMGTLAVEYAALGYKVIICTNDKDMMQLVGGNIWVMRPDRVIMGPKEVFRTYGVRPSQIVDFLCLLGDKIDNVKGVVGCGEKKARDLLATHGTLKAVIKARKELTPAMGKAIAAARPALKITPLIVTLKTDERHKVEEKHLRFPNRTFDMDKVRKVCAKLGLTATLKQIEGSYPQWTHKKSKNPLRL